MRHQYLNENLKELDNQLVNINRDHPDQASQKFVDKVLTTSKRLLDRNFFYFSGIFLFIKRFV
jgi:hypothetical protein